MNPLLNIFLPGIPLFKTGKVRSVFDLGDELLIVASDRVSAFDVILPSGIPKKGEILTRLSEFWFNKTKAFMPNHMISTDPSQYPPLLRPFESVLAGRSMLVRKTQLIDIECVVRGYLIGTAWKEYQAKGSVCDIALPSNLQLAEILPEPIFTPALKASSGHDENVSFERISDEIGSELALKLKVSSLALYRYAAEYAGARGIILADTKFEFGLLNGELILIDEALTPDSSRYWEAASYRKGISPPSYDKQIVRDYLEGSWDKNPPAPLLPSEIIQKTSEKYEAIAKRLMDQN